MKHLLYALALISLETNAQTLSLNDCIKIALDNKDQLKLMELDLQTNPLKVEETQKLLYPRLTLNAGYTYNYQLPRQFLPASSFGGPAGTYKEVTFGVPHATTTNISASQVIYNKPLFNNIEKIKASNGINEINIKKTKENIVYQIGILYFNAQKLLLQKQFLQQNILNADKLIKTTKSVLDNGMAKKTDLDQIELNKKIIENQVDQLDISYTQLMNELQYLLNVTSSVSVITPNTQDLIFVDTVTKAKTSTDVLLLREQKKLLGLDLEGYRYEAYPTLNAFANYNYNGTGKTGQDAFFKFIPSGAVGLQLVLNLYDWGLYKTKKAQKAVEFEKIDLQTKLASNLQESDIRNQKLKIKGIYKFIALEKENIALAQTLVDKAQEQYKIGLIAIPEVVSRENVLAQSQNSYLQKFIELKLAEWDLKKSNNSLVE